MAKPRSPKLETAARPTQASDQEEAVLDQNRTGDRGRLPGATRVQAR